MENPSETKSNKRLTDLLERIDWKSPTMSTFISLLALVIIFTTLNPLFFRAANLLTILMNASVIGVMATGMTMVIITAGIDLSVAALSALSAMVMGAFYTLGVPLFVAGIFGLFSGVVGGFINGVLVAKMRVLPLIATLSMSLVYRALAYAVTGNKVVTITNEGFKSFGRAYFLGIPVSIIYMIIFYIVVGYVLGNTSFGRRLYAIGGNRQASYLCGINIVKIEIEVYIISGVISAFAGLILASQAGACIGQSMMNREFDVIAGVVLGGVSMKGGKGKVLGTFLGVVLLAVVANGMVMVNLQSYWQNLVKGIIMISSIMLDANRNRKDTRTA